MAQLDAFRTLRARYDLPIRSTLEDFLSRGGRLLGSDRDAFLDHLLDRARYREVLERELHEQVVYQYNLAHSWWAAIDEVLARFDARAAELEGAMARLDGEPARRRALETRLAANRAQREAYAIEQAEHIRFMERLDARYPRDP